MDYHWACPVGLVRNELIQNAYFGLDLLACGFALLGNWTASVTFISFFLDTRGAGNKRLAMEESVLLIHSLLHEGLEVGLASAWGQSTQFFIK